MPRQTCLLLITFTLRINQLRTHSHSNVNKFDLPTVRRPSTQSRLRPSAAPESKPIHFNDATVTPQSTSCTECVDSHQNRPCLETSQIHIPSNPEDPRICSWFSLS
ncbi:hypothetical protein M758_5G099200 [Ceratodon purpureus]|nr:hypothetical protein M758_5G099200 [Ceratodon purpureus]